MRSDGTCVSDEILSLDHFEDPVETNHINKAPTPSRINAACRLKDMPINLVELSTCKNAADLGLLSKRNNVGFDSDCLMGPELTGNTYAGLDLIKNQQCVILMA